MFPKMIRLTKCNGDHIYFNVNNITAVTKDDHGTAIYANEMNDYFLVKESPEDIWAMFRGVEIDL